MVVDTPKMESLLTTNTNETTGKISATLITDLTQLSDWEIQQIGPNNPERWLNLSKKAQSSYTSYPIIGGRKYPDLEKYIHSNTLSGKEIIDFLSQTYPQLGRLFQASAQVGEGYSIEEHTLRVFALFEKNIELIKPLQDKLSKLGISNIVNLMSMMIILHDLGKPLGHKKEQVINNKALLKIAFQLWSYSPQEVALALDLISEDIFGPAYIQIRRLRYEAENGTIDTQEKIQSVLETVVKQLQKLSAAFGMDLETYATLKRVFFNSDAKSYPSVAKQIEETDRLNNVSERLDSLIKQSSQFYDPFIHGTNSSILALLPRTKFQILSPIEMVNAYHLVPMCGEIELGGLVGLNPNGRTCFARLSNEFAQNRYPKNEIITKYAIHSEAVSHADLLSNYLWKCYRGDFRNINVLLIYLLRAKQWGLNVMEIVPELKKIEAWIHETKQYYYMILCLADHLAPNSEEIDKRADAESIYSNIYEQINIRTFKEKSDVNFESLWKNPNNKGLEALIQMFVPPHKDISLLRLKNEKDTAQASMNPERAKECFDNFLINQSFNIEMSSFLSANSKVSFARSAYSQVFKSMKPFLLEHLEGLELRFEQLRSILSQSIKPFDESERNLIENNFPLILLSNSEEFIKLYEPCTGEYRAIKPLRLGVEIAGLATDTLAHKEILEEYLRKHMLDNLYVILFDDLILNKRPAVQPLATSPTQQVIPTPQPRLNFMYDLAMAGKENKPRARVDNIEQILNSHQNSLLKTAELIAEANDALFQIRNGLTLK
ncbi:MAG: uncharacterized protein JWM09_925 [Francisellaceae bacterium]|nr:uncharacterized protein [Francisellaceae bacterium]